MSLQKFGNIKTNNELKFVTHGTPQANLKSNPSSKARKSSRVADPKINPNYQANKSGRMQQQQLIENSIDERSQNDTDMHTFSNIITDQSIQKVSLNAINPIKSSKQQVADKRQAESFENQQILNSHDEQENFVNQQYSADKTGGWQSCEGRRLDSKAKQIRKKTVQQILHPQRLDLLDAQSNQSIERLSQESGNSRASPESANQAKLQNNRRVTKQSVNISTYIQDSKDSKSRGSTKSVNKSGYQKTPVNLNSSKNSQKVTNESAIYISQNEDFEGFRGSGEPQFNIQNPSSQGQHIQSKISKKSQGPRKVESDKQNLYMNWMQQQDSTGQQNFTSSAKNNPNQHQQVQIRRQTHNKTQTNQTPTDQSLLIGRQNQGSQIGKKLKIVKRKSSEMMQGSQGRHQNNFSKNLIRANTSMDEEVKGQQIMNATYFDNGQSSGNQLVQAFQQSQGGGQQLISDVQQQEEYSLVSCMSDSPVKFRNTSAMQMDSSQQNDATFIVSQPMTNPTTVQNTGPQNARQMMSGTRMVSNRIQSNFTNPALPREKDLSVNVSNLKMIDQIIQKSNKNSSVKSGKRSTSNNQQSSMVSTTNKRKKQIPKRQQSGQQKNRSILNQQLINQNQERSNENGFQSILTQTNVGKKGMTGSAVDKTTFQGLNFSSFTDYNQNPAHQIIESDEQVAQNQFGSNDLDQCMLHMQGDYDQSSLVQQMNHQNRQKNISQIDPNQLFELFQNQNHVQYAKSSKNNSLSSLVKDPNEFQFGNGGKKAPNKSKHVSVFDQQQLLLNNANQNRVDTESAQYKMSIQKIKDKIEKMHQHKESQNCSQSPSAKSRYSMHSKKSRHSRTSKTKSMTKTQIKKVVPDKERKNSNLLLQGQQKERQATQQVTLGVRSRQGHESVTSKAQKQIVIQKNKMIPQTTLNIMGGAQRLEAANHGELNRHPRNYVGNMLIQNNETITQSSQQSHMQSNRLKQQKQNQQKMMTEAEKSRPINLRKQKKSGQKIDRTSKLVLDIPQDDESNEIDKSPIDLNSMEQQTKFIGSNQSESTGNVAAMSKPSVQYTEISVQFGDKVSRGSQEDKNPTFKVLQEQKKQLMSTHKQKYEATPKTYIFNNARELKNQEIKLQNVVVQSKNQSQKMGLKIKFQKSAINKANSDHIMNSVSSLANDKPVAYLKKAFGKPKRNSGQAQPQTSKRGAHRTLSSRFDIGFEQSAQYNNTGIQRRITARSIRTTKTPGSEFSDIQDSATKKIPVQIFRAYEQGRGTEINTHQNLSQVIHNTNPLADNSHASSVNFDFSTPAIYQQLQNESTNQQLVEREPTNQNSYILFNKKVSTKSTKSQKPSVSNRQSYQIHKAYQNQSFLQKNPHNKSQQNENIHNSSQSSDLMNGNIFYQNMSTDKNRVRRRGFQVLASSQSRESSMDSQQSFADSQDVHAQILSSNWAKQKNQQQNQLLAAIRQRSLSNSQQKGLEPHSGIVRRNNKFGLSKQGPATVYSNNSARRTLSAMRNNYNQRESSLQTFKNGSLLPQNMSLHQAVLENNLLFQSKSVSPNKQLRVQSQNQTDNFMMDESSMRLNPNQQAQNSEHSMRHRQVQNGARKTLQSQRKQISQQEKKMQQVRYQHSNRNHSQGSKTHSQSKSSTRRNEAIHKSYQVQQAQQVSEDKDYSSPQVATKSKIFRGANEPRPEFILNKSSSKKSGRNSNFNSQRFSRDMINLEQNDQHITNNTRLNSCYSQLEEDHQLDNAPMESHEIPKKGVRSLSNNSKKGVIMIKQKNVILAQNQKSRGSNQNVYGHENLLNRQNQNAHMISGFSKFNESLDQSEQDPLLQNTFTEHDQSFQDMNKSGLVLGSKQQTMEGSKQILEIQAEESIEQKLQIFYQLTESDYQQLIQQNKMDKFNNFLQKSLNSQRIPTGSQQSQVHLQPSDNPFQMASEGQNLSISMRHSHNAYNQGEQEVWSRLGQKDRMGAHNQKINTKLNMQSRVSKTSSSRKQNYNQLNNSKQVAYSSEFGEVDEEILNISGNEVFRTNVQFQPSKQNKIQTQVQGGNTLSPAPKFDNFMIGGKSSNQKILPKSRSKNRDKNFLSSQSPNTRKQSPSKSIKHKSNFQHQIQPKIYKQAIQIKVNDYKHQQDQSQGRSQRTNSIERISQGVAPLNYNDHSKRIMTSKTASKKHENYYQNNQYAKQVETRSTGRGQMALSDLGSHDYQRKIGQTTTTTQKNKSVMSALQVFGVSTGSHDGSGSTENSQNMRHNLTRIQSQQQNAFTHVCTVQGQSLDQASQMAHQNTITSIQVVPTSSHQMMGSFYDNADGSIDHGSLFSQKKIFTGSLDSSIKCWNFLPSEIVPTPQYINQKPLQKFEYKFNEIQQNGRASKRIKVNSLVYFQNYDLLVSGGSDRFINIYENCSTLNSYDSIRYRCSSKIAKQGSSAVINKMCAIDNDKLIVGQSDEKINIYSIARAGSQQDGPGIQSSEPLASYQFEESAINNLCSLNEQNLFISSALNRSISVWDIRQTQPIFDFKDIHYDTITSIDKYNQQIFASASDDGYVNMWDLRMGEFFIKQLKIENNERIASIKFVNDEFLLIAHADKISVLSSKDKFTKRHTFRIGSLEREMRMTDVTNSNDGDDFLNSQSIFDEKSQFRINQMEFNCQDSTVYLALQGINCPYNYNTVSSWSLDFSLF